VPGAGSRDDTSASPAILRMPALSTLAARAFALSNASPLSDFLAEAPMELVERDAALQTLRRCLAGAATRGQVVLVAGEAGIGKTSLLRSFAASCETVWWGACDALQTPHPLAPLLDIARDSRARFRTALAATRPALFEAVLDELRHAATPVLMVIEDAHWADDATLDLLKFIGRRIQRTRALLTISFRDDEVSSAHPLRRVIGELPHDAVTRIALPRLTPQGVELLAQRADRQALGVHAVTRGNPFFVTEMLREPGIAVPRTVQDLVLARFARLRAAAQDLARLVAMVPGRSERWLVDALAAPAVADLEACLDSGLLVAEGASLAFRHELARVAIESASSPPVAEHLHARVLAALAARPDTAPARLVHHAVRARDAAAVSRYAPLAAEQARGRGAHREAAAQWRSALADGVAADERQREDWLEAYALECQLTDQLPEATAARTEAGASYRRRGATLREAHNLSHLAIVHVLALRNAAADADSQRAIDLLDAMPSCGERAYAYWVQAQLRMLNRDWQASVDWATRAIALAEEHATRETWLSALNTQGTAMMFIDYAAGCAQLERVFELARADGRHWIAANALSNLGSGSGELLHFAAARPWLERGIAYATEHEVDFFLNYATAWLAIVELHLGHWDAAATHATAALARAGQFTTTRLMALVAIGRLRLRRGDPGVQQALDEALALAEASGTLQRIAPVRAVRAEWAMARGDRAAADAEAAAALPLAQRHGHAVFIGELAMWRRRAGGLDRLPPGCGAPFVHEAEGRWAEAAAAWEAIGCHYERARALCDGDAAARQQALAIFETLDAQPAAEAVRRQLRQDGIKGVARGARPSTREHPYGLTAREVQVLELLCAGLRNADIAERLSRSVRTVDHHVESVLAKLGVATRIEAMQLAQRAGLAGTLAPRTE
jgi:DNA-binding CsgD family transcriptional regulator